MEQFDSSVEEFQNLGAATETTSSSVQVVHITWNGNITNKSYTEKQRKLNCVWGVTTCTLISQGQGHFYSTYSTKIYHHVEIHQNPTCSYLFLIQKALMPHHWNECLCHHRLIGVITTLISDLVKLFMATHKMNICSKFHRIPPLHVRTEISCHAK